MGKTKEGIGRIVKDETGAALAATETTGEINWQEQFTNFLFPSVSEQIFRIGEA